MVDWPQPGEVCLHPQQPALAYMRDLPSGLPCQEGGSIPIKGVNTQLGIANAMVFYTQATSVPEGCPQPNNRRLAQPLLSKVDGCFEGGLSYEIPVDLTALAECIGKGQFLAGTVVSPRLINGRSGDWLPKRYSALNLPFGKAFFETKRHVILQRRGQLIGFMTLAIVVVPL